MKFKNLFLLIFVFILFSCSFTPNENKSQNNSENDTILEDVLTGEVLETESLFEDKEDTSTVLNVIDERYWTSQGSTLWTVLEDIPCVLQKTFEVTTSKLSGTVEAGYGLIF